MAPQHSALFDLPVRFVVGTGILSGAIWTMTRPSDKPLVLAAEAETGKKKALIPPGLQGTESEAMYAKRLGMAKNEAKM